MLEFETISDTKTPNKTEIEPPPQIYFKGAQDPLSNMFRVENGLNLFTHTFYYAESAYQWRAAVYADDFVSAEKILKAKDGCEAKSIGDEINKPTGWYDIKESVMEVILDEKFKKCPEYREALKAA